MAATVHLSFALHKGEAARRGMRAVWYRRDPEAAGAQRPAGGYLATTGICVDDTGRNESEDANLAARNALLAMIDHLAADRGYTRQQAYAICSVAVNLRLSQLVDVPNFVASATLPLSIFSG
jgi:formamidase